MGLPASRSASRPSQPQRARTRPSQPAQDATARPRAQQPRQLPLPLGPTRQPHVAHARVFPRLTCSRCHRAPRVSHTPAQCCLPHPRLNRLRDRRPTVVVGWARGSRPGHGPVSPLCRAYATAREPLDATKHISTTRSPSIMGA